MSNFHVIRIDEQTDPLWEQLAKSSAQGGEFLLSGNLRTMAAQETPRAKLVRLAVLDPDGDGLLAGWALLVRRRLGIRPTKAAGSASTAPSATKRTGLSLKNTPSDGCR